MNKRKLIEKLPFEVDARVAIQLGRESISSSLIAIVELVKNAYDADAENVLISLRNVGKTDAYMTIEDNGNGMTYTELKSCWLRIGTDIKHKAVRSKDKKRIMTGAKGLGRLGIDRLCSKLILQTKTEEIDYVNELEITWSDYEVSGKSLSHIKHGLYSNAVSSNSMYIKKETKGTRLKLTGVKDNWTSEAVKELKLELSLLVSPFGGVKDFSIELDTEYKEEGINGIVTSEQYLGAAEWSVKSAIDENGMVFASMSSNLHKDKFQMNPVKWKDWIKTRTEFPRCGPLVFEFYYIPRRSATEFKKIDFERRHVIEFLDNNCGLRIYRDYFRTKPYGNPDGSGDWLKLAYRRSVNPAASSKKGWPVAPQQVVGAVFISRNTNVGLIDQTNREGLVEEAPFFDLKAFASKIIEWFEANVVTFNQANHSQVKEAEKAKAATNEAKNKIKQIKKSLSQIKAAKSENERDNTIELIVSDIDLVEEDLNENEKQVDELERHFEKEKNVMANLASLGILTVCFGHEAKGNCNRAFINARELQRSFEQGKIIITYELEEEFKKQIRIIMDSTDYINNFAGFALENVKRDKRHKSKISISTIARKVINTFSRSLKEKQGIKVITSDIADNLPKIKGFEIDWESIFINLLTNSIWAFHKYVPSTGEKIIKIAIKEEDNFITIHFADNGKGLENGTEDRIFIPNFTTKRNEKGVLDGTGMGLAIVSTFVCDHASGTIEVKSPGEIGGAEFVIKIPTK